MYRTAASYNTRTDSCLFFTDNVTEAPVTLYKIPIMCLAGQICHDKSNLSSISAATKPPTPSQPHSLLSPLVNPIDCSDPNTIAGRRSSPLLRHKLQQDERANDDDDDDDDDDEISYPVLVGIRTHDFN